MWNKVLYHAKIKPGCYALSKLLSIFFIVEMITMAVLLVVHLSATFAEKYVYLTKDGLIYFLGRFDFDKCRYYFEEQVETEIAHKLIDKNVV